MKAKRALALAGAILLFAMYLSTLVFALIDHPAARNLLKASIACTIILPVLLYAYTLYRITRPEHNEREENEDTGKPKRPTDS